jgi:DNA repair exonuclease SbcCD nuclease subunit
MKLLITSDWHLDRYTAGLRRLPDIKRSAMWTVQYAVDNEVDNYIHLGDMMNADSGSCVFECIEVLLNVASRLTEAGIESHWLSGNHDVIEDGSGNTTLAPLGAFARLHGRVHVHTRPSLSDLLLQCGKTPPERVHFVSLPFSPLVHAYDATDVVTRTLSAPMRGSTIVVAGHMTDIPGILPGSETKDMARGRNVRFPREQLVGLAKEYGVKLLMLNGHYHERQCFRGIHIPGSLERLTFGEANNHPGFLIVEV